jgi:DNA-binding transcriptional MerR regulator
MFRRKDVELLLHIKHLLYNEKFTIEGARKALKTGKAVEEKPAEAVTQEELFPTPDPLPGIRTELVAILKLLT